MRLLGPISVAYSASAYFRVFPCKSVAMLNSSAYSFFRGKSAASASSYFRG